MDGSILTINGGSSSIKFALYSVSELQKRELSGKVERIGLTGTNLTFTDQGNNRSENSRVEIPAGKNAVTFLVDWLEARQGFAAIKAVGHRVVHGMKYTEPELVTPELIKELRRLEPFDPDHLPREIELIQAFGQRHPDLPQVACFDTAFHSHMPRVARILPIPHRYFDQGIQRYGFHGLSYAYLLEELARLAGVKSARGRVVLAHLGNGASLAAVQEGRSIDTSMGFTPAAGIVMSTRSGDLDPGLVWYLAQSERMNAEQFNQMVNHQSGLLGVSGISPDMRDLLARERDDARAADAVALFCYQLKKWIGSFAAALGGLDTLVFSGGIGENSPVIRARVCAGLAFLGVELNDHHNTENAGLISAETGRVAVRIIHTDEEVMIARSVARLLKLTPP